MRRIVFLLVWMTAVACGATPAVAQSQETPGDDASEPFESLENFKSICKDIKGPRLRLRRPANALLEPIERMKEFHDAIRDYCAVGDFVLKPKNYKECTENDRLALDDEQVRVILGLPLMREGLRRFELECVVVGTTQPGKTRARLELRYFEATIVVLRKIRARQVYLRFSKLLNGARIEDVDLDEGLRFNGVTATGPVVIKTGAIGALNRTNNRAIEIRNSSLGHMEISAIVVSGDVYLENLTAQEDIQFSDTTISGDVLARGVNVGADLVFEKISLARDPKYKIDPTDKPKSDVCRDDWIVEKHGGSLYLEHARVGKSLRIASKSTIEGGVQLEHARVEGALILQDSNFSRTVTLDHAVVPGRILIENSVFVCSLTARRVQTSYFGLAKKTRAEYGVLLNGIVARELMVREVTMLDWFYIPNGKLHVLEILDSSIKRLDCSDCLIEQFATLAAEYRDGVRLAGTRIGGSLIFSWESAALKKIFRSSWHEGAVLDLTGTKTQVVQADDVDLRVGCTSDSCGGKLVKARLAGFTFDQFIGGRRTILRSELQTSTVLDAPIGELAGWILNSGEFRIAAADGSTAERKSQFDPQPFEMFAAALERSGRADVATELRIRKRDAQLEHLRLFSSEAPEKIIYSLGKSLVSYGYRNERAIYFLIAIIFLGAAVHLTDRTRASVANEWRQQLKTHSSRFTYSLFFSIDRLVPQLTIDRRMDEFSSLHLWTQFYFYVHRAVGAVVLVFAVAGISGLFK